MLRRMLTGTLSAGLVFLLSSPSAVATDGSCFTKLLGPLLCATCQDSYCNACNLGQCTGTRVVCTVKRRAQQTPSGYGTASAVDEPCWREYGCVPSVYPQQNCSAENPCAADFNDLINTSEVKARNVEFTNPGCTS